MRISPYLRLGAMCVAANLALSASAQLTHQYSFTGDASDSVGGAHGVLLNNTGNAVISGGQVTFGNDGSQSSNPGNGDFIDLPDGMISANGNQATFETWFTWTPGGDSWWQRVYDFGISDQGDGLSGSAANADYIMLSPRSGPNTLRSGYREGSTAIERWVEGPQAPVGVETHVAVTYDYVNSFASMYINGTRVSQDPTPNLDLSTMSDVNNWLGRAQWGDPMFTGSINEFRVYNEPLSPAQVAANHAGGPDSGYSPVAPPSPSQISAPPVHRYSFDGDATDSIGGADGSLINNTGNAAYGSGQLTLGNTGAEYSNDGTGDYVDLPNGMISSLGSTASFEVWTAWTGAGGDWQRIFDFGDSNGGEDASTGADLTSYIFLTPQAGGGLTRFGYQFSPPREERVLSDVSNMDSSLSHVVVTWDEGAGEVHMYVDGELTNMGGLHMSLADLNDVNVWLGRAQWNDLNYTGTYDEFRIYDYTLTADEVAGNFGAGPNDLNVIPEPATLSLLVAGIGLLALRRRR